MTRKAWRQVGGNVAYKNKDFLAEITTTCCLRFADAFTVT